MREKVILLSHGDGGLLTHRLIQEQFLPLLQNPWLNKGGDAAVLPLLQERLAVSTDSFVVSPLFFPGGNIGKLAVCGTVNDLVVSGARPLWITAAFIISEGLPLETLSAVIQSMAETARQLELPVVAGDTKVVDTGNPDNLFINTTGIGLLPPGAALGPEFLAEGDAVVITGTIGDHGAAIMARRMDFSPGSSPASDCAPLDFLLDLVDQYGASIKMMRDPTRGGVATALKEIASDGKVDIVLEETRLPIKPAVKAVCDILGLDPLYLASEGRALMLVDQGCTEAVLEKLKKHSRSKDAAAIGTVNPGSGNLYLKTALGGTRPLQMLAGTPLPRIC